MMKLARLVAIAAALLCTAPAHAQLTKTQLNTQIGVLLPDNTTGQITPASMRTLFTNIVAAYVDQVSTGVLPSGQILVGSASGVATARTMSGDCTISNTGVLSCPSFGHITPGTTGQVAIYASVGNDLIGVDVTTFLISRTITQPTIVNSLTWVDGVTTRFDMTSPTANVLNFGGVGNSNTMSIHLDPGSGTLPTGTITEFVGYRTHLQAFGGNYGRWSYTNLGSAQGNISGIFGEFGGTTATGAMGPYILQVGIENPPSTFTTFEGFRFYTAPGISEDDNQGAVAFGSTATVPRNTIALNIASIGSAGQRDSHAILWEGKFNNGSDGAAWWRQFVDVTSNAGASTFRLQQNLDGAGWNNHLSVTDAGALSVASLALTTPLPATSGGSGFASYAIGDLLYADTTTTLAKLADVATGNALISGGVSTAPSWGKIGLTTHVSGILGPANGGTGVANNAASTITISGAFSLTATLTGTTSVTFPTSGTLATTAGASIPGLVQGDTLYASAVNTISALAKDTNATRYLSNTGTSNNPAWAQVNLANGVTGTLTVPNGGTGIASGTSGGIPYFSSTTTIASSALLATNQLVLGGGAGTTPATLGSLGTTTTVLHGNAAGAPTFGAVVSADLNITTTSCTNQFVTAISSSGVGTCTTATLASAQFANQGTTTTVLHGNAAGNPSFAAVSLTADITGVLAGVNGGTGLSTAAIGDIIYASATTPTWSRLADVATGSVLVSGGVNTAPAWSASPTITTSITTPLHIGGTTASSTLTLQSTSGAGTTDSILMQTASQVSRLKMISSGFTLLGDTVTPTPGYPFVIWQSSVSGNALMQFINGTTGSTAADGAYFGVVGTDPTFRITQQENAGVQIATNGANAFLVTATPRIGFITISPSYDFSFDGQSARQIGIERHTTSNTAGNGMTLSGGGATSGATNKAGGSLTLLPGVSTGSGTSSVVVQAYTTSAGATSDNSANTIATFSDTGILVDRGNVTMGAATKTLVLKQGANGTVGTFVCTSGGSITVNNTNVAITDTIIISLNTAGGTISNAPALNAITAATSFVAKCATSDTSTYNYAIIKNAAWLLERDLDPAANDNAPAWIAQAA